MTDDLKAEKKKSKKRKKDESRESKKEKKLKKKLKKEKKHKRSRTDENTASASPVSVTSHQHPPSSPLNHTEREDCQQVSVAFTPDNPRPLVESSALPPDKSSQDDPQNSTISLLLFYQYVEPPWSDGVYKQALSRAEKIAHQTNVMGRMRVAKEGFNCTLTATCPQHLHNFCAALRTWMPDVFCTTEFKITHDLPLSKQFSNLKVMPVSELVNYGLEGGKAPPIQTYSGTHLEPNDYHKKLAESDTVVIDVRNHYEASIGHFDAPNSQFLDPNMRKSTEFPVWLDQPKTKEQLRGKQVLMYCTGGIRCERASALLKYKMANDPTVKDLEIKGVYQLQGGIDKYFKQYPEGGYWKGKNYTFDKRYTHAPVANVKDSEPLSNCEACQKPWDRFGGKRRCPTCGVPSLLCKDCAKGALDESVRCDLCVKQGVRSKASLRCKEEEELELYQKRQKELGLLNPTTEGAAHDDAATTAPLPNLEGITRLSLKNMCRQGMTEELLMAHLPGITHIVWRSRQGQFFGQGWVEMDSPESAANAVARSGERVLGRPLYVAYEAPDAKDVWPPPRCAV